MTKIFDYLIPSLLLIYHVSGALSGRIYIFGQFGETSISGSAAWIACLWPIFWLLGIYIEKKPTLIGNEQSTKSFAFTLKVVGVIAFLYALFLH